MWLNAFQMAFSSFRSNRGRTFLTMLGIVIGAASVITLMALGEGFRRKVNDEIASLGTNLLMIYPGRSRDGHIRRGNVKTLTMGDAQALRREIEGVSSIAPMVMTNLQVESGNKNLQAAVVGTAAEYAEIHGETIESGRFFNPGEAERAAPFAVLGHSVASNLFGRGIDPVGREISIGGKPLTVVGRLTERGTRGMSRVDDQIYIPLDAFLKRLSQQRYLNLIDVAVTDATRMDSIQGEVERVLTRRHRIAESAEEDFVIYSQSDLAAVTESILLTIRLFLAAVALVSLVTGGVGIMNIMLVNVSERTKEIGLMKAVGATQGHIRSQFLIEALALCGFGGILGAIVGVGTSTALAHFLDWRILFTPQAFALALGFALSVGLFFGLYPAEKAARLDPIEALRRE